MWASLEKWLADPKIKLVQEDSKALEELRVRNEFLEKEVERLRSAYAEECFINIRLVDTLKSNGIKWR